MLEVSTVRVDFKTESALGHFRKIQTKQEKGQKWLKNPRTFRFATLPLEMPDTMKLNPWKFYKIVLHPFEFQVKN